MYLDTTAVLSSFGFNFNKDIVYGFVGEMVFSPTKKPDTSSMLLLLWNEVTTKRL